MPFLLSSTSRKKKSYIHNDAEESARRRDMIKQKLYAEHMIGRDEEDCDDYLERRLNSRSPVRRTLQRTNSSRRVGAPNYIDPSGSLRTSPPSSGHFRAPPRRAYSEQNGRKALHAMQRTVPPLPPRRTQSFANNNSGHHSPESSPITPGGNTRFSMAAHPNLQRQPRISPRMSSRLSNQPLNHNHVMPEDDDGEENEMREMMLAPAGQRKPPPRRRRATVSTQTLEKNADAAMRFGPPRRVKSHYPGSRSPRSVASIGMMENNLDFSDHSKSSKDCSEKNISRKGLTDRSSSFFRKIKRSNSSSLKKATKLDTSDHTTESQKSWFTSGSGTRSKEDIYNSALHRAKERQAIKSAQNYLRSNGESESIGNRPGSISLSEQLSRLPPANDSDDDYEEDEGTESKSIFSSIIQKIEDIYDDCS